MENTSGKSYQEWQYGCPLCSFTTVNYDGDVEGATHIVRRHSVMEHGGTWASIGDVVRGLAVTSYPRSSNRKE